MNFEKHVISELKIISEKIDNLAEATARQDERIKQNTKDIESQKKKIWSAIGTGLGALISVVVSKFVS